MWGGELYYYFYVFININDDVCEQIHPHVFIGKWQDALKACSQTTLKTDASACNRLVAACVKANDRRIDLEV